MQWTRRRWVGLAAAAALGGCSRPPGTEPEQPSESSLLERAIVLDLHCDTPMRMMVEGFDIGVRNDYGQVDLPRLGEGGFTGVFFSVYTPAARGETPQAVGKAFAIIDRIKAEAARLDDRMFLATNSADIVRAEEEGRFAALLGIEGGHMINSSLETLRRLFAEGGRYLTLTHSKHTPWAGSSGDAPADDPGLTEFGREVVGEMNRLGMMVDVSHVSDKTFWDAVEASQAPVIASHSSCRALAQHPRNMTDEMIRRVADGGGAVHINYYNGFLSDDYRARRAPEVDHKLEQARRKLAADPPALAAAEWELHMEKIETLGRVPLETLLDHYLHAIDVGGVEAVGMGSDFDGVNEELPAGMEDVTKLPNLVEGFRERGLSDNDIEKILGGNTLRVMRDVEAAAESA